MHSKRRHIVETPTLCWGQRSVNSKGSVPTGPAQITLASLDWGGPQKTSPVNELFSLLAIAYQLREDGRLGKSPGSPASLKAAALTTVSLKAISESKSNSPSDMFTAEEIGSSFCFLLPKRSTGLELLQGLLKGKGHV